MSDSSSVDSEDSDLWYYMHDYISNQQSEEGQDHHDNDVVPGLPDTIESLKDLAAGETAKYWGCAELACTTLRLDDHLLEKICAKSFPVDEKKLKCCATIGLKSTLKWNHAEYLIKIGAIKECTQIGFLLVAQVELLKSRPRKTRRTFALVSVKCEKQNITHVSCPRCSTEFWCEHVLAAILYRSRFPNKVPVHSPMTETLSSMSRDQLQKLIQFTVNINAPQMILPLYQTIVELRDPDSDTSQAQGAPDPTYDGSNGDAGERLWLTSLNKLKSNFKREIREINSMYEGGERICDEYSLKVTDLLHNKENDKAGDVLAVLAAAAAEVTEEDNGTRNLAFVRALFEDLDTVMACFVLSCDCKGREHVLDVLRGIHMYSYTESGENGELLCTAIYKDLMPVLRYVSLPSEDDQSETTDVEGHEPEEPQFLFHNSVRAEKFQTVNLHRLEQGDFTSEISEEPIQVILFRFQCLVMFGSSTRDLTNYGVLLLRKCMQMTEKMFYNVDDSSLINTLHMKADVSDDTEAGPSQLKARRVEKISSVHLTNTTVLSQSQLAYVIMYLCHEMYTDTCFNTHNSNDICLMVEAMLCLEVMERKFHSTFHLGVYLQRRFTDRWTLFTSEIEESIRNKSFVRLYSIVFLKQWNATNAFYGKRNKSLLTLLTTTEDLPAGWRAQLCGNVVCSTLKTQSTKELVSSEEGDVDVDLILQMTSLVAQVFLQDGSADCRDTVTKILEACLICTSAVTSQRVVGIFREHRSHLHDTKHNELMLRLLMRHLGVSNTYLGMTKEEILDEILTHAARIGVPFSVIAFQNWELLSETFDRHQLAIIFNTVI